jgi:hypothetical protein
VGEVSTQDRAMAAFDAAVGVTAFMAGVQATVDAAVERLRKRGPDYAFVACLAWAKTFADLSGQTDYARQTGMDVVEPSMMTKDGLVPLDKVPVYLRPRAKAAQFVTASLMSDGNDAALDVLTVVMGTDEWAAFCRELLAMVEAVVRPHLADGRQ